MKLKGFQIWMYRCILDSGWIEVSPLTVLVGKNESGKTSLLKALHKLNPHDPEPYNMAREWPRGYRDQRDPKHMVCKARFELTDQEIDDLKTLTGKKKISTEIEVSKNYDGEIEVDFLSSEFPNTLHPNDIDDACNSLTLQKEPVGDNFRETAQGCLEEIRRLAGEGRFSELTGQTEPHLKLLQSAITPGNPQPHYQNEINFVNQYSAQLRQISDRLTGTPSVHEKAHEYIVSQLPTFIYMSDYRIFQGHAHLDQVQQRNTRQQLTEEDKTLLMIMKLSGLDLDQEVEKGKSTDREQRQYDLSDAAATLTNVIEDRWQQRQYKVDFRADGQQFYTFVQNIDDPALIRLEERSKGFQWFFSFDLLFMHESQGTFQNCVLLLDEPGLHLHPDAQTDLLRRLEAYAQDNTLIYTSHLPFMIDLREPDRIRVLNETQNGTVVTTDLTGSQPEAKLVLQAALGISGRISWLVAEQNLIVEGVHDYWLITELSNLLIRSGTTGIFEEILITPAGGATEAAYIATFMIGQGLNVVALFDSDEEGKKGSDALVKKWLTRYSNHHAQVLSLGNIVGTESGEFAIEDLFPEEFYLEMVEQVYGKQLKLANITTSKLRLKGNDQLVKRVERALANAGFEGFNKGSVAKALRLAISKMKDLQELPEETRTRAQTLIETINNAMMQSIGTYPGD